MRWTKIFLLTLFLLTFDTVIKSMETTSLDKHDTLEQLNQHVTFMYEQAFFCELLTAIVHTRRTDEFHADVQRARDKVNAMVFKSLEHDSLKFDAEVPPHERLSISNIYYVFRYLIRQKAYKRLKADFNVLPDKQFLPFLNYLMPLLEIFAQDKKQGKRDELLQYIHSHQSLLESILAKYKSDCNFLRSQYCQQVGGLRIQAMADLRNKDYIFHKYLEKPKKILPVCLDSDVSTLPSIHSLQYIPMFSEAFTNFSWDTQEDEPPVQSFALRQIKPLSKQDQDLLAFGIISFAPSSVIPTAQATGQRAGSHEKSLSIGELLFVNDFQEYWLSRVNAVLKGPDELTRLAHDFVKSYFANYATLNHVFAELTNPKEPADDIRNCLAPFPILSNSLVSIRDYPKNVARLIPVLANTIEISHLNRSK